MATELYDDPLRSLSLHDIENILNSKGFEVQTIRRVVVGGDSLRITVEHDGLVASILKRKSSMAAAVVKFNTLADPVGTAS